MIKWVIPQQLARSPRPGDKHLPAMKKEVSAWIKQAKAMGFRSVISLLSNAEMFECFSYAKINLLDCYREAEFEVSHFPISEHGSPPESASLLAQIEKSYRSLPKPCLVHCNAGIARTGIVVDYLLRSEGDAPQA